MPLDDAIALVGRSFHKYIEGLREKGQAATSLSSPGVFLPPSSEISYLLNLLADNRVLTFDELNKVITYLQERRDKLAEAEGRPIFKDDNFGKTPPTQQSSDNTQFPIQEAAITENKVSTSSSSNTDLTSKILSLFSNAGGSVQGVPPANDTQQQTIQSKLPLGTPAPPQAPAPSNASLINFDNPNVQKALDNLINSTPGLLKNINTPLASTQTVATTSGSTTNSMYGAMISSQTPTQNVTPNLGSAVNSMYGAMISSQTQNLVTQNLANQNLANSLGSAVNRIYGAMFSSQTLGQIQNPNQVGLSVGYGGIQGQLMANLVQGLQMQPGQISQGTYNIPNQGQTGTSYMPSSQSRF